jgi:hypothetical protein
VFIAEHKDAASLCNEQQINAVIDDLKNLENA